MASKHASSTPPPPTTWALRCPPGLHSLLLDELRDAGVIGNQTSMTTRRQRNADLVLLTAHVRKPPPPNIKIADQMLTCLAYGRYKISHRQLESIVANLRRARHPFRVMTTVEGTHFDRGILTRWLERTLRESRIPVQLKTGEPLWVFCVDEEFYICREKKLAPRPTPKATRAAATLPTVAAAMAYLGRPRAEEVVFDPFCGTGTLLRAAHEREGRIHLIGIDSSAKAIGASRENLRGLPRLKLERAKAQHTGLRDGTVDLVLSNLPFGKQFGDPVSNRELYRDFLRELSRLARGDQFRAVLLTSDVDAFEKALSRDGGFLLAQRERVKLRGEWAEIFLIRRA